MISFRMVISLLIGLIVIAMISGCGEQKPKSVLIPVKPPTIKVIEATGSQDGSDDGSVLTNTFEPTSSDGGTTN